MKTLLYKIIKSKKQYFEYCNILETLVSSGTINHHSQDEIDLLTLLIEDYDQKNSNIKELDPIALLKGLMNEHQLNATDLVNILGVSKGLVSDILNFKKGLSKEVIRKLAAHFHLRQEAFNRPYALQD